MKVASCGIHGFHETIGLDVDQIRVFWTLESDEYAVQTAYRVVVSTSKRDLADDSSINPNATCDSGKVASDEQRNIRCADLLYCISSVAATAALFHESKVYATFESDLSHVVRRH